MLTLWRRVKRWCVSGVPTITVPSSARSLISGMMSSSAFHSGSAASFFFAKYSSDLRSIPCHGSHGSFAAQ